MKNNKINNTICNSNTKNIDKSQSHVNKATSSLIKVNMSKKLANRNNDSSKLPSIHNNSDSESVYNINTNESSLLDDTQKLLDSIKKDINIPSQYQKLYSQINTKIESIPVNNKSITTNNTKYTTKKENLIHEKNTTNPSNGNKLQEKENKYITELNKVNLNNVNHSNNKLNKEKLFFEEIIQNKVTIRKKIKDLQEKLASVSSLLNNNEGSSDNKLNCDISFSLEDMMLLKTEVLNLNNNYLFLESKYKAFENLLHTTKVYLEKEDFDIKRLKHLYFQNNYLFINNDKQEIEVFKNMVNSKSNDNFVSESEYNNLDFNLQGKEVNLISSNYMIGNKIEETIVSMIVEIKQFINNRVVKNDLKNEGRTFMSKLLTGYKKLLSNLIFNSNNFPELNSEILLNKLQENNLFKDIIKEKIYINELKEDDNVSFNNNIKDNENERINDTSKVIASNINTQKDNITELNNKTELNSDIKVHNIIIDKFIKNTQKSTQLELNSLLKPNKIIYNNTIKKVKSLLNNNIKYNIEISNVFLKENFLLHSIISQNNYSFKEKNQEIKNLVEVFLSTTDLSSLIGLIAILNNYKLSINNEIVNNKNSNNGLENRIMLMEKSIMAYLIENIIKFECVVFNHNQFKANYFKIRN